MWLGTIDASKVSPEVRPRLEDFQLECADVLHAHFFGSPRGGADAQLLEHLTRENAELRAAYAAALKTSNELVAAFASQPRGDLRDDESRALNVSRMIRAAAHIQQVSWQAIHGDILKTYQVRTYKRLPQLLVSAVELRLHEYTTGARAFARVRALPPPDRRQTALRFNA